MQIIVRARFFRGSWTSLILMSRPLISAEVEQAPFAAPLLAPSTHTNSRNSNSSTSEEIQVTPTKLTVGWQANVFLKSGSENKGKSNLRFVSRKRVQISISGILCSSNNYKSKNSDEKLKILRDQRRLNYCKMIKFWIGSLGLCLK